MAVAVMASLEDVLGSLRSQLGGNDLALGPVCTRVALRTGVNLRSPASDQLRDAAAIAKVLTCLSQMGYTL
jgi:hypothetical protein